MSLIVVLKSTLLSGKQNCIERHVPFTGLPKLVNEEIDYIQADGDELYVIQQAFTSAVHSFVDFTIPMPISKKVVRWYGDIAKTIYFNL